jgi:hypothetical protein
LSKIILLLYTSNCNSRGVAAEPAKNPGKQVASTVILQIVMTVVVARQDKSCQQNSVVIVNPFLA